MNAPRILIVEDEAIIAESLKIRLGDLEYMVVGIASNGPQAIEMASSLKPDLILMDIVLKGEMDGIEAAGIIRQDLAIPVIYLTAYSDEEVLNRAQGTEPYGYLVKPFNDREIHASIKMALAKHKLEKEVKESRDWFVSTLKCIGDAVIVTDHKGVITFLNKIAQEMTGWELADAIGKPLQEIFTISDLEHLKTDISAITEGRIAEFSLPTGKGEIKYLSGTLLTKDKTEIPIEDSFSAIHAENGEAAGSVVVFRDITDRKKAEAEKAEILTKLRQSQKMEAIGTLAGGIAHDFNNLLGVILGYTEMLLDESIEGSRQRQSLEKILVAGYRSRDLVKQILSFSRQSEVDRILLTPGPIVRESVKLLRATIPANIEIRQDINAESGRIRVDPTQFSQVIVNLCTNAYQAMEEKYGILTIILKQEILDEKDTRAFPQAAPGAYIKVSISDTGVGISPEIMGRIFEPYFTTKEPGKGTGLGLATVHGIVKAHNGMIRVDSKPGEGTCFHVFFPVAAEKPEPKSESDNDQVCSGNGCILLVDDEEMLAEMGKDMLERLGYSVVVKHSGIEALEIFSNRPDAFDLVLTDQSMPNMTGDDLAQKVLQIRPDIPVILCTGYSETVSKEKAKALGIREYAMKPLAMKDMARLVSKVLDSR